jgi:hypothetical protein
VILFFIKEFGMKKNIKVLLFVACFFGGLGGTAVMPGAVIPDVNALKTADFNKDPWETFFSSLSTEGARNALPVAQNNFLVDYVTAKLLFDNLILRPGGAWGAVTRTTTIIYVDPKTKQALQGKLKEIGESIFDAMPDSATFFSKAETLWKTGWLLPRGKKQDGMDSILASNTGRNTHLFGLYKALNAKLKAELAALSRPATPRTPIRSVPAPVNVVPQLTSLAESLEVLSAIK